MTREIYIVGNWKMNQKTEDIKNFFSELKAVLPENKCHAWIAPQFIHMSLAQELSKNVKIGAQNCSHKNSGAFTGDISSESLKDMGSEFVIIGHSERRAFFKEDHVILNEKTKIALENGLKVIFCIGETLEENEKGITKDVLKEQLIEGLKGISGKDLENIIIAYEPVWAIGTGKTATPQQAQDAHAFIREHLGNEQGFSKEEVIILYGGSVKPANIDELLTKKDIDGALVGGASLKAADFGQLCKSASK